MSVRRPLWVQRLAFVLFELTDPAGAAQVRMSRGALNEAGEGPSGRRAGLDDPASLSASGVAPGSPSQQAADLVPGLSGRAQLFLFALIFLGTPIGWALAVLTGAVA